MRIRVDLEGETPMMVHNIRLANPDDPFAKQIAAITRKRTKTEEDRQEIFRLEWLGSLYTDPEHGIAMPTANIRRCWQEAGKVGKQGRDIVRGVTMHGLMVPIVFPGRPKTFDEQALDALYRTGRYSDVTLVGVNRARTTRCRPFFHPWALSVEATILPTIIDPDAVMKIIRLAGQIEGLSDNRVNGYGRYVANIEVIDDQEDLVA